MKSDLTRYLALFILFVVLGVGFGYAYSNRASVDNWLAGVKVRDVSYAKLSDTSVKISFVTSRPVSTKIEYGTSVLYGVETVEGEVVSEHTIVVNGLLPNKDHNFRVFMRAPSGKTYFSGNYFIKAN